MRNLGQTKLIESANAVKETRLKIPIYLKRSWRERLLSRPWKPQKSYRLVLRTKMEPAAYFLEATTQFGFPQPRALIYHPILKGEILKMIEEANRLSNLIPNRNHVFFDKEGFANLLQIFR
jgi:hypothetical protein